jgi:hypothetical protein
MHYGNLKALQVWIPELAAPHRSTIQRKKSSYPPPGGGEGTLDNGAVRLARSGDPWKCGFLRKQKKTAEKRIFIATKP